MFKLRKSVIAGMPLPFVAAIAACTPTPQGAVMYSASSDGKGSANQAAVAPPMQPVETPENPLPNTLNDTPAEAMGRRTLSTAFVRVGPDGLLTVKLKNGNVLVLRNVSMRPKDYCGETIVGGAVGKKYCGGYADVASARPGGSPTIE